MHKLILNYVNLLCKLNGHFFLCARHQQATSSHMRKLLILICELKRLDSKLQYECPPRMLSICEFYIHRQRVTLKKSFNTQTTNNKKQNLLQISQT